MDNNILVNDKTRFMIEYADGQIKEIDVSAGDRFSFPITATIINQEIIG